MIPKIIHYCWLSNDPIPEILLGYMNSWKEKLSSYKYILWDLNRFDINISIWVKQAFAAKKYAFAADFIRLYAVYKFGGIYLDMDIEVIKPFDDLLDHKYMFAYEDDIDLTIEAGCFGAEKNSSILKKCLEYYEKREFIKPDGDYDMLPLPQIMQEVINKNHIDIHFYSSDYFTAKCFNTGVVNVTNNTYCIHNFAGSWLSESEKKFHENKYKIYAIFGDNIFSRNIIRIMNIPRKIKKTGFRNTINYYFKKNIS
jgi:mannosyltransferase OCH1-like enzyme